MVKLSTLILEKFGDAEKAKWLKQYGNRIDPKTIDKYIAWFDKIRTVKPKYAKELKMSLLPDGNDRFDISKYEMWDTFEAFVDAVRAHYPLGQGSVSTQLEIDGKPLFTKNGLDVYYADSPRACIKYKGNVPYSWCIARPDSSNMYYTYRLKEHEPAFYFVKDIEATKEELGLWNIAKAVFSGKFKNPYHFFVLQVLKNASIDNPDAESYVVTNANNDGDNIMSWNKILKLQPKLKGLQSEFLPKPLSPEEKETIEKYKGGLDDYEFRKLSYEEKERYLDVYPSMDKKLSDSNFENLPEDLKNKYIGFGIGLTEPQFNLIKDNKNLVKRYIQITERKFDEWNKQKHEKAFSDFGGNSEEYVDYEDNIPFTPNEVRILLSTGFLNKHINDIDYYGWRKLIIYDISNKNDGIIKFIIKNRPDMAKTLFLDIINDTHNPEEVGKEYVQSNALKDLNFSYITGSTPKPIVNYLLRREVLDKLTNPDDFLEVLNHATINPYGLDTFEDKDFDKLSSHEISRLIQGFYIDRLLNKFGKVLLDKIPTKLLAQTIINFSVSNYKENIVSTFKSILKYAGNRLASTLDDYQKQAVLFVLINYTPPRDKMEMIRELAKYFGVAEVKKMAVSMKLGKELPPEMYQESKSSTYKKHYLYLYD